jgi:hypothetical protein
MGRRKGESTREVLVFGGIRLLMVAWLALVAYTKHANLMSGLWSLFGGFAVLGVSAIIAFVYFRFKERA